MSIVWKIALYLLTGEHHHPDIGFQSGYALELLCHFCGDRLANDRVYPLAIEQFEAITSGRLRQRSSQVSEGGAATAGGLLSSVGFSKLAKEANDRLDRICGELDED